VSDNTHETESSNASIASTHDEAPEALIEPAEPTPSDDPIEVPEYDVPSDQRPLTEEPTVEEPAEVEPAAGEPVAHESTAPVVEKPVVEQPVAPPVTPTVAQPNPHVLYVEAPQPPRKKGNRGFGTLIAIVAAVIFAVLYAVTLVIIELVASGSSDVRFLSSIDFWIPVIAFAVGFILLVLIVNRAGWAAHVLGSLFVGVFVYFGTAGAVLVHVINVSHLRSSEVSIVFQDILVSSGAIAAGLLAREVSLWVGFAIAARGRRVKARNVEARDTYDREFAEKRSDYERQALGRQEPLQP
jgi:hypothetical protein